MLVRTNLNTSRQSAREIVFEPTPPITATDVQEALEQIATTPAVPISPTNVAGGPYAPVIGDTLLWVDTSTAVTISLPTGASRAGRTLQIKDITGNANVNNITLDPQPAETIDGLDPMLIDVDYGGVTLYPKPAGGWTTQP
jgi:hypothetical protein